MAKHLSEGVLFPDFDSLITKPPLMTESDNHLLSKHRRQIERFRNLDLLKPLQGPDGYKPIMLKAVKDIVPSNLVAFTKASRRNPLKSPNTSIVHFFEYDYVLERFWNCPRRYLRMLKRYMAAIGPDFSVECSLPEEVNEWHLFINRALSFVMQTHDITVIPNLSVCPVSLYDKVFGCLEANGIYAISSVRANGDYFSRHEWYKFVREAIKRLSPQSLIVYGNKMPVSGVRVYYFDNENLINLRNGKKQAS